MPDSYSQCPKCGYKPPQPLPVSATCPACGIYFFKWEQAQLPHHPVLPSAQDESSPRSLRSYAGALLQPLEQLDEVSFYVRCTLLGLLALWSWSLFACDYRDGEIGASFMHNILLPIHEAGHVLFRPFGEFMMILGGSLFQLALPWGIGIAFIRVNRDNFGAAIGLWWGSISLLDLAPYIYDALHPQLILLGGHTGEDGPHDWIYLLSALGQLHNAQRWGMIAHTVGGMLMLAALVWALAVLRRQHQQAEKFRKAE
jgi:hypothetical protein